MVPAQLIEKYNVPGPRYTSYPTVPYWDLENFSPGKWLETLQRSFAASNQKEGISIYIHLPYCESLCTFCACHKRITKQHSVEDPYIAAVLKEWQMYLDVLPEKPVIKEIHLGGGTPTFFSTDNLHKLLSGILSTSIVHPEREFSFEGHPNNTTADHLKTLYDLGFRRVSFGVQDYDTKVQKAINRMQPFENVAKVTEAARSIGYDSISHDLVFGLPFQKLDSVISTIELTKQLQPDRIAFYSYAHVPWIKGVGQRGFDEKDLPSGEEKRELYEKGKELLEELGYHEIGMDHFSLTSDTLYQSMERKTIHRNFMGYTSSSTQVMISLGASAISDSWYAFAQNEKDVDAYVRKINAGELTVFKGHILTEEDLFIRKQILNIMCLMETPIHKDNLNDYPQIIERLRELESDDLINIADDKISVNESGRSFLRNICMAYDLRMIRDKPSTRIFSMVV
ncbi:oxygen-independent coproporphyrinogen III oxidase [Haoranjiania flava]|uniref:Coproporphyrinogen-III oxidase n=1 Tax=Haoranjiania flava TaxID=1856322 RepID=A0AAE3INC2_9BACT|nr:oxygen-independent coproporphyrinogen III oxidase [Haoranjiania flava]MCU7694253.1 oxygen-independent coproporphyrinogen III oxidase [Haoranjiania flava]